MRRTALGGMYLCSFVLCCLGSDVFGAAMKTLQKPRTKLSSEVLMSDPARLWSSPSHSRVKHMEILEVRGFFKRIVTCQQKKPDEDTMMTLEHRKNKSISLTKGRKLHYIGQTIVAGGGKNKVIITNRKREITTKKKIPNGPLTKRNNRKFGERHFRKARKSKRPTKHLYSPKHRKPRVMMEQEEDEMYSEVKRKTPMSRRIESFTRPRRNNKQVLKRKVLDRRANSSNKALERSGVLIPVSPNGDSYQELFSSADGEVVSEEATTIKSELRGLHIHADTNKDRQSKENVETFSTMVTTTFDGLQGSEFWTHGTTTRNEILSQQEHVTSEDLHKSNNESESSEPSFKATAVIPVISLTSSQNEIMTNKVTFYINEIRGDDNTLETTTNRQITQSWNNRVLEPTEALPTRTPISTDSWIQTPLHLQPEEIGGSIVDDQIQILLPNNSVIQVESSEDSEVHVVLVQKNGTLQVTETTHVQSTDSVVLYPTSQKDDNITNTVIDGNEEMHDSVFSPLEMVLNHGSETKYCKPGYKYHAGACKSMCDMGDFFCENGGQCVIVETLGAMCRCHQTNNLCYRGECCRLSLTPFQLICVIGSCCIFVSVFLGSISLLIRRMDIKAVSKSVRTRLWISTLMPGSRSSSFSHFAESDLTSCSEYDSPDLSSFNHTKKMTHEGGTLKCERTRL